jgi:hypothetical protein
LPGQHSPEGTGSAIHYDLNTMAMKRFKNILYVAEFAVDQSLAIARAIELAENNQAKLIFFARCGTAASGVFA